ncbi:MAG: phage polymerase-related protein [Planctomycetaceae bacterium]|nr:phage polymerase-related protein [Planctomycetaceae bacterium]
MILISRCCVLEIRDLMSEPLENANADIDVRRLILQTLESWNAAGITHLTAVSVPALVEPNPIVQQSRSDSEQQATQPHLESNVEMARKPAATSKTSVPSASPKSTTPETTTIDSGKSLTFGERVIELKVLSDRVAKCTRCEELATTRTQTVFGVGNPEARIVFIGEAPGADEDAQGEPFVGKAGQLLNKIIEAMKLTREEIYICNILRCRPPGNRLPEATEASNCREYLDGQLRIINPEFIVCWGSCAAQNLLASTESIGKLRKRWFQYKRARVLCTYHPSYLLRNPAAKKDVWEDMQLLMKELGIPVN